MSSGYKKRPPRRKSHNRDATLLIIATEGTETEKIYFEDLTSPDWFGNSRVQVEVLSSTETDKAPKRVLAEIDKFKRKYKLDKDDELWIVIDVDRWGDANLSSVAKLCQQKGYSLAISNPCFELWLLLHLRSLDDYSEDMKAKFLENQKVTKNRSRLDQELLDVLGSYNKAKLDTSRFLPFVEIAIERAASLETSRDDRWPQNLGTRVYLLTSKIVSMK